MTRRIAKTTATRTAKQTSKIVLPSGRIDLFTAIFIVKNSSFLDPLMEIVQSSNTRNKQRKSSPKKTTNKQKLIKKHPLPPRCLSLLPPFVTIFSTRKSR